MSNQESGIYIIDKEYRIISYNDVAKRMRPDIREGEICYHALMGLDVPCAQCPVYHGVKGARTYFDPKSQSYATVEAIEMKLPGAGLCHGLVFSMEEPDEGKKQLADAYQRSMDIMNGLVKNLIASCIIDLNANTHELICVDAAKKEVSSYSDYFLKKMKPLIMEDSQEGFKYANCSYLKVVLKQYDSVSYDFHMKSGSWYRCIWQSFAKQRGDVSRVLLYCVDVTKEVEYTELKSDNYELRRQNAMLNFLTEDIPAGYYRCTDAEGFPFEFVSRQFLNIVGYTQEEMKELFGNCFLPMIHPEDCEKMWAQVYSGEKDIKNDTVQYVSRIRTKSGCQWVHLIFKRVEFEGIGYYQGLIRNIADEMEMREALNIVDGLAGDYLFVALVDAVTGRMRIHKVNEEGCPIIGQVSQTESFAELTDYFQGKFVLTEDKNAFADGVAIGHIVEQLQKEKIYYVNTRARIYNKTEYLQFSFTMTHLNDGNGKIVLAVRIITESVEKETKIEKERQMQIEEMLEKESTFRTAICSDAYGYYEVNLSQNSVLSVYIVDPDGVIQDSLGTFDGIHKLEEGDSYVDFADAWIAHNVKTNQEAYRKLTRPETLIDCYRNGNLAPDISYWCCKNEGEWCIRETFYLREDKRSGDIIALGVMKDITDQMRKEQEQQDALRDALAQAEHASRAKTIFLNNMSHDIRTPMNAIIGFTALASTHVEKSDLVKDYLGKIMTASNHLLSLINDVLDMSRIESGTVKINSKECSLPDVMHDIKNIVQADIHSKQLELFIDTVDVVDESIICDKLRLNQILLNCLSNAMKFTKPGGTVSLRVRQKANAPEGYADYDFLVRDTGIGMSADFAEHIFEPFTREQTATVSGIQGTGLGMAITKNIVDMMGGTIKVKSEVGKGTEFTISLRFRTGNNPKRVGVIRELEGLRALVADDDFNTCISIGRMLKSIGMRSEFTTSGKEAVLRAKAAKEDNDSFKVYIIDWLMPDMNGVEVVRRIRMEVGNEVQIIILTAYDWSEIEQEAREAGVTAFCSKPIFLSELHEILLTAGTEQVQAEKERIDFEQKRILLVEDVDLNREIAETVLREGGFEVESAENGQIAVEMMKKAEPGYYDLVLMDIQMPVMDGYEATRRIRTMDNHAVASTPIIAMTANAFEEDRQNAFEAGMNGHLAKPIRMEALYEALKQYLK